MKKGLFIFILSLSCMFAKGQELKNVIKFSPLSLPLNSAVFEYERMLNEKNALEFGLGIPVSRTFVTKFGMDWNEGENITNDKLGIFSLRAAYRHYTGKSLLPKGFYIAPYLKYQGISAAADNKRDLEDNTGFSTYDENYDTKINTFSAGFQLGYQFLISNTVTLDLFFFGLEAGLGKVDADIYISDPDQVDDIFNDVQDAVDDLPSIWGKRIDVTSDNNYVYVKGKNLFYPMYRGGISLGIAF